MFSVLHLLTSGMLSTLKYPKHIDEEEWSELNAQVKAQLAPLVQSLNQCSNAEDLSTIGNQLSMDLHGFLKHSFNQGSKEENTDTNKYQFHEWITVDILRKAKNKLRKMAFGPESSEADKKNWNQALKTHAIFKKRQEKSRRSCNTKHQETLFKKNFFSFAKDAVNGMIGKEQTHPLFSKERADEYFHETYEDIPEPKLNLRWFPKQQDPSNPSFIAYPDNVILPKDVKQTLKQANRNSSPGPDGITYQALYKLTNLHAPLATLYNKCLKYSQPPSSWAESKLTLIHKKGDPSIPSNFRMIALSSTIGKVLHLILSRKIADYLTANNLINPTLQKGFLPGICGCIEHNICLEEVIMDAKTNKKTAHITFFDLKDAFGSVPHKLIEHSLYRNFLPVNVIKYITILYDKASSMVQTKGWISKIFKMSKGTFQGDPLSPIIFNMVFNPLLQYLESIEKSGYKLGEKYFITLPYADDFTLITNDKRRHQKLMDDINKKIADMGLTLAPSKCRTFSITGGRPNEIDFKLGQQVIPNIKNEDQKFLGKLLFFNGKEADKLLHMKKELEKKLTNVNGTLIRNEYKVDIYKRYIIPSLKYLLTVHDLNKSTLTQLDNIAMHFLKKWLGVPKCATRTVVHYPRALDIPSLSSVYNTCHATALTNAVLKGEEKVTHCIDKRIEREAKWKKKGNATSKIIKNIKELKRDIASPDKNSNTYESYRQLKNQQIKACNQKLKKKMKEEETKNQEDQIARYKKQGDFLTLLKQSEVDAEWKSYIYGINKGAMKFIINSSINTLPTASNLKQWGKRTSDKCHHCDGVETTQHILNGCKTFLDEGRYTWRHDNILHYLYTILKDEDIEDIEVYADLPDKQAPGGGTIPSDIVVTAERPDLVIVNKDMKEVQIYELTVPFDNRIDAAHELKMEKYSALCADIFQAGWICHLNAIEIGSRGLITKQNKADLRGLIKPLKKQKPRHVLANLSKLAVLGSYKLFLSRKEEWISPGTMKITW